MNTSVERLVKEGDEVSNVPCHYFSGIYYLKDKAHLESYAAGYCNNRIRK